MMIITGTVTPLVRAMAKGTARTHPGPTLLRPRTQAEDGKAQPPAAHTLLGKR